MTPYYTKQYSMEMSKRTYTNSKELILEAAFKVLAKEGSKGFTTEAVIRESGLSKAGFFYNFKSKTDLLLALSDKLMLEWQELVEKFEKEDKNPVGRFLRANVKASIVQLNNKEAGRAELNHALSELSITEPENFKKYANIINKMLTRIKDSIISKEQSFLVCLVLDGLWCQSVFPTLSLKDKDIKKLTALLIQMTESPIELKKPRGKK